MTPNELADEHRRLNKEIAAEIITKLDPGEGMLVVSQIFERIADRCEACRSSRGSCDDDTNAAQGRGPEGREGQKER